MYTLHIFLVELFPCFKVVHGVLHIAVVVGERL